MVSRRRFLQVSTVAAGSTLAARSVQAEEKSSPLPPSIANLKSMKDQAKPITREERRERQENARRLMEANDLKQKDLVDVFGTPSIVSEVLNGKRGLTIEHIKKLSRRFHVSPEVFLQ